MTAITRRGRLMPISIPGVLAVADDVTGSAATALAIDVSGATRCIVYQDNNGTAGTAGIDIVEISKDGGTTWAADTTVLPITANDSTGTIQAAGALNAAGVEPTTVVTSLFKTGPYEGPTLMRVGRKTTTTTGTTWVTGAPSVSVIVIGAYVGAPTSPGDNGVN